jgi:CRISPR type I-E-associated protein CasB/Cse2
MNKQLIDAFVSRLESIAAVNPDAVGSPDRGALAALRRTLSTWPSVPAGAMRVVAGFLPENASQRDETIFYTTAALFALYPCSPPQTEGNRGLSLGASLKRAAESDKGGGPERRLLSLLGSHSEDLPNHLRHLISYLSARSAPVDYRRLMLDWSAWDSPKSSVQRQWGRAFWGGFVSSTGNNSTDSQKELIHHAD